MHEVLENALSTAGSDYLRSAKLQPVQWLPWSESAFALAASEDKPILLDVGAVWCHWCHVMDRESYEDREIADLINTHFVAIKVDRDERPDIDSRYQAAVSAISGQGGWPLTVFLTPEAKPYFGGTYFPPEERYGQPSFRRVLAMMSASFRDRRLEVEESAGSVVEAIAYSETFTVEPVLLDDPGRMLELTSKFVRTILEQFDPVHGGFGSQPKFPHPAVLDLLLDSACRHVEQAAAAKHAALFTLEKMSAGGVFDHLAGGFHRYAVDERWVVPHFEKMSYDNAALLRCYIHAFQAFGDTRHAETALDIMRWMDSTLSDREHGGFYASQDADALFGDDGSYFTWSRAEAANLLSDEELRLIELYFDVGAVGDMRHDSSRNVLFRPMSLSAAAQQLGILPDIAKITLSSARAKLLAARLERPTPRVDRTIYTAWSAMCISAYVLAGRVLQLPDKVAFAQQSLDRVLSAAWHDGRLSHVVAYSTPVNAARTITGWLDDYVFLGHASLDVWEANGELRFYRVAEQIAEALLSRFHDDEHGGFYDTDQSSTETVSVLRTPRKPLQDAPTPAGNPVAAALLLRLHTLSGKVVYKVEAMSTMQCFAGVAEHLGLNAASFGLTLRQVATPAVQVVILGAGEQADSLEKAALSKCLVTQSVIRLRETRPDLLPAAFAETLTHLPPSEHTVALVCVGNQCLPPIRNLEALEAALAGAA